MKRSLPHLIWILRPFQEYFTYIEPIVHQRWAKTGEPGGKPSVSRTLLPQMWPERGSKLSGEKPNRLRVNSSIHLATGPRLTPISAQYLTLGCVFDTNFRYLYILTLVMRNELKCHVPFQFSANQITWSSLLIQCTQLNANQCKSRSVGFFRSPTDLGISLYRHGISGICRTWLGDGS